MSVCLLCVCVYVHACMRVCVSMCARVCMYSPSPDLIFFFKA